jgi:hypothetical protein
MRILPVLTMFTLAVTLSFGLASAAEQKADSRVVSVGLFKNGLSVVQRLVTVPGPGTYRIEDVPEPVHGTFWIESDARVVTRLTRRTIDAPLQRGSVGLDLQDELAGKSVTIHFTDPKIDPATGTVVELQQPQGEEAWNRSYEQPRYGWGYSGEPSSRVAAGPMLVLDTKEGRTYISPAKIAYLQAQGVGSTAKRRVPVLLLTVEPGEKREAKVLISYLAKGMAWAPSYRVDITDHKDLVLRQQAVIKNELGAIDDAQIQLISGFPSMAFGHVTSPLSMRTNWTQFFQQLNQRPSAGSALMSNAITQQRVAFNEPGPGGLDLSATPSGEGVDLHYQPIGKHTLGEGDSMSLEVATGKAAYERIVDWTIPDNRDVWGRWIEEHVRQQDPEKYADAVWDAVRFKNPFPFPMTTAPAMIVSGDRFNGQQMSYWVNAGEETSLRVTKALSVRTRAVEEEEKDTPRVPVSLYGWNHYRATVKGELVANNHRKEPITLIIRRSFSGELISADQSPKTTLLEEGVYSLNKRNQLIWTMTLEPGKEVKLNYRYTVLVRQ